MHDAKFYLEMGTLNIIIPLAGIGSRFQKCGYSKPKPMIKILGKEIIFWLLDSLDLREEDNVYIPYNKYLDNHGFSRLIQLKYPNVKKIAIPNTRGASETVKICIDSFGIQGKIVVLDGDTWYEENILDTVRSNDGNLVAYFESKTKEPIYSYILTDRDRVIEIKEKIKISNKANSGCYVFADAKEFSQVADSVNDDKEKYISQVISKMIFEDKDFKAISVKNFHVLGTPEQAISFSNSYKSDSKRFCFDLDNTLVTSPRVSGDYSTVEPIEEVISYLKKLKDRGHKIIIYTARRMKTHSGNVGAVVADISSVTIETLKKFKIPYDELYFGKPYAHFYIDDLMVDPRSDLSKELGFYMEEVKPRHFNTIQKGDTFKKTSTRNEKIKGEIHYYKWVEKNCPEDIKAMFPKMISNGEDWFETDLVQGLNFSTLYLNQILNEEMLDGVILLLKRLHAEKENNKTYFEYENFGNKFSSRLSLYDHEKYGLSKEMGIGIKIELEEIAKEGFKKVMIHGDPVFSNILMDTQGKIKFVDMRGIEGDVPTVYGHELYDFAKLYQSIWGYDEVLLDKEVDISYKKYFIDQFEKNFKTDEMKKIRTITASLFLSLIPLHDDESKYKRYVDLAINLI